MPHHLLQGVVAPLRLNKLYQLYFIKLVHPVKPPDVFAVGSSLATETRGIGSHLYRKLCFGGYGIAVDIGNGHLSGRDEIKVIGSSMIHLAFLIRKLAGAKCRRLVYQIWRIVLLIAGID